MQHHRYRDTARDDIKSVFLTPQQLRDISSEQLERRAIHLARTRDLTRAELDELARQRRMVLNREQARRSRLRQKEYVRALEEENEWLRDRLRLAEQDQKGTTPSKQPPPVLPVKQEQGQHYRDNDMDDDYFMFSPCSDDCEMLSF